MSLSNRVWQRWTIS